LTSDCAGKPMAGFGMKMIKRQMFGRAGLPMLRIL
jgi:hypothetical protein